MVFLVCEIVISEVITKQHLLQRIHNATVSFKGHSGTITNTMKGNYLAELLYTFPVALEISGVEIMNTVERNYVTLPRLHEKLSLFRNNQQLQNS